MRKHSLTFEELVNENKKQLLEDPEALSKIEKRIEDRQAKKENDKLKKNA
ncbi:FbpB family small basic protein [Alkalihalobacillus sp. LMS39]|nr:FbpB family small basic protein [Alkalihalobacillus sp. LMS39]UOE94636.1 FbpB family small basic protein [Alkalihalobacillus sp. LMS39]